MIAHAKVCLGGSLLERGKSSYRESVAAERSCLYIFLYGRRAGSGVLTSKWCVTYRILHDDFQWRCVKAEIKDNRECYMNMDMYNMK